ncbi:hypothetical protein HX787_01565 [Pseudomonas tolaasii]|uniref:Uncharacterized protein n=2 Tax=Pseudomonas tolaasii TaxID=29442 RepID=A0A7Y8AL84_PSETO|nr:hypothetical protein [Pseudomonas tolaasii]MBW1249238.1 hypothetical protein [Pseudomonas tolaasii]MBW4794934.1 hypothetical protein [Pseudomonas tolaasii]MBY8941861.1 hypothetical protein [Pseudomonas tolaasii]NVZ45757.1 hypothetical protein [Pseudomonas tolaasii]NWA49683.1 hypothetical protein [Pseudomonas tolaasii]
MISLLRSIRRHLLPSFPKAQAHPCENPLFNIILAFWALWHCRHARPPDTAF